MKMSLICIKGININNRKGGESWKEENLKQQYGRSEEHQQYESRKEGLPQEYETRKEERFETESRPSGKTLQHSEETYGGDQRGKGGGGVLGAIGETIVEIAQTTKDLVIGEDQQTQMESHYLGKDQNDLSNTQQGK